MKKITNMKDMMLQQIRSLYDADRTIYKSLPLLKEKAYSNDLKELIDEEIEEKLRQQHRMEIIFTILKEDTEGQIDDVMRCMTKSQRKLTNQCTETELSDTMMIITGRAMATHQINGYQTAITCAVSAGCPDITRLLRRALREEKGMEKKLGLLEEMHLQSEPLVKVCH
ncbi:DUF892 family protein [Fulvivirga sp. 29W222]|uniref:DUF892 family protein n=1 Tax=Fulvivirga marina TaxID=2494733 RepID=A0A937G269_9BACT|nr:DUF892 family protein [Fulvivirga marina]MBL6448851.1 DUF892 family protein [Fulvivirga marina]